MKKVTLTIGERLVATRLLNEFVGDKRTLALVLQDSVKIGFSEEEKTAGEIVSLPNGSIQWSTEKDAGKEIELNDEVVDYIKQEIEKKDKDAQLTLADRFMVTLFDKLNA